MAEVTTNYPTEDFSSLRAWLKKQPLRASRNQMLRALDRLAELEAAVRDLLAAEGCCPDCDGSGDRPEFDRLHQLIHGEVRGG